RLGPCRQQHRPQRRAATNGGAGPGRCHPRRDRPLARARGLEQAEVHRTVVCPWYGQSAGSPTLGTKRAAGGQLQVRLPLPTTDAHRPPAVERRGVPRTLRATHLSLLIALCPTPIRPPNSTPISTKPCQPIAW